MQKRWIVIGALALAAAAVAVWLWSRGGAATPGGTTGGTAARDGGAATSLGAARDRAPTGGIDGVVVDDRGAPVAGAVVRAVPAIEADDDAADDGVIARAGGDGRFTLEVAAGRWALTASTAGRAPAEAAAEVVAGRRVSVELRMVGAGATLRGRVVDATGGPVAGALVVLAPEQGVLSADRTRAVAATTVDDGSFELGAHPGRWRITTSHAEYVRDVRTVEVAATGTTIEIQLVPGGVVEGTVRDRGTGDAVGGVRVSYAREVVSRGGMVSGGAEQRERGTTTAGADGRFRVTGLGTGRIVLSADTDDDRASDAPTEVLLGIAETATDVDVFVAPALSIAGKVVFDDGSAAAGAEVTVEVGGDGRRVLAGDDGSFRAGGLQPGRYMVFADTDDSLHAFPTPVELETTPVTGLTITLRRGVFVTGTVEPPQVAEVSVMAEDDSGVKLEGGIIRMSMSGGPKTRSAPDGTFRIGPFEPGPTTLGARAPDGRRGEAAVEIAATGTDGVVIELEARGRISGRVVTAAGKPVAGAVVSLKRKSSGASKTMFVNGVDVGADRAPCDGDGRFAVAGLDPGTWMLTPLDELGAPLAFDRGAKGDADAAEKVELAADQNRDDVELVVEAKDGVIRGVVRGPNGTPVADAWVTVSPDEVRLPGMGRIGGPGKGRPEPPPEDAEEHSSSMMITVVSDGSVRAGEIPPVLTGDDGRFELRNLRRGTYHVSAEGMRGGARGALAGVATGSDVVVPMQMLSSIAGTVTVGGKPLVAFSISVEGPTRKQSSINDAAGRFELDGLDPGSYQIEARGGGGSGRATAVVEAGKQATVTIAIEASGIVKGRLVDASGAGLPGRMVIVGPRQKEGEMSISLDQEPPITGADGSFEATSDAGPRTLFTIGDKGTEVRRDLDVVGGQTVDLGTLTASSEHP